MPKLKTAPRLPLIVALPLYLICCLGLGLASLYFSAGAHGAALFDWYLTQPLVLDLNLLPFLLLGLLLLALTGRVWLAFSLDAAVCLFFSWAQFWKLMARSDPIYAEDLLILAEAQQMAGQYIAITPAILCSAAAAIIAAVALFLCRSRALRLLPRISLGLAVLVLALWLYPNVYTSGRVYNSLKVWPELNQWIDTNRYISRGGIYPFLNSIPDAIPKAPEGYDPDDAEAMLSAYPSDDIPEDKKVSLIVTQLEAFCDLSTLTDRITGADPYAEYHALLSESYHGRLLPNVFAGGTIDTERCVLTGFSRLESFRRPSWSYARYFAEQGYALQGAHAGYEAFYNRLNVNENLGLPGYRFIENYFREFVSGIPGDDVLLPDITSHAVNAMASAPVFSFNVTYQNHGPYASDSALFSEPFVPQNDLSDSDYRIVNNYLFGIRDTGRQISAMADSFRSLDEPVILVFFGDHKPWLGEQSVTYAALGIDITSDSDDAFYHYYATDYLFWANDAAKAVLGTDFTGIGPDISPCFLMNVLFEKCGWEGPGYTKLTDAVLDAVPMLHTSGRYLLDGTLTDSLPADRQDPVTQMEQVQYYLTQDAGGIHP
ncbi:MAG: LTA synthase family protein [Oscillospiraceae bacterium]|nr:LTA synthase family protein [Oscillospiraceae bacterium]